MTITPAQVAKLAKDHATDFAEKVDIQFLMEFYIENYLDESYDDIEGVMYDILTHKNKDRKSTKEFMIESGISPEDAEEVITNTLDGILVD